jgi:hypothetical protein
MSVQWIEHKGKKILFIQVSGLDEAGYLAALDEAEQELLRQPAGDTVLTLWDISGSHITLKTKDRGKELVAALEKKGITSLTAMVGVTALQRIVAQAISRGDLVYYADSLEAAKDWLVEQG